MQHPAKKKFKKSCIRRWLLVIMGAALVLAAAFVLLLPVIKERYPADKPAPLEIIAPAFRTLEIRKAEELESVTVYPSAGESYTLQMHEGTLCLENNGMLEDINDLYAADLLEVFTVTTPDLVA